MALEKRGKCRFGEDRSDLRSEIERYSEKNGDAAQHFADASCPCGGTVFRLLLDDTEGAAVRRCIACAIEHPIGDSGDSLSDANLEGCACPCGEEDFEVTVGVSLFEGSDDVRWIYIGCRCPSCGLLAVYGDWKNEFQDYRKLLARV